MADVTSSGIAPSEEDVVSEPVVSRAGEGAPIDFGPMGHGNAKIGSKETDDAIGAWDFVLEGGGGAPPPHIHNSIHEVIVVLEGDAEIVIGERTERVGPGTLVYAPPGTVHGVSPSGSGKLRAMILTNPASKHEQVIDAFVKLAAAGPPDPATMAEYIANVDVEILEPPA
jgi:mannose-6-phosphate isomerase-like protein (cupin superfamily)